jgi:hypothetical protein
VPLALAILRFAHNPEMTAVFDDDVFYKHESAMLDMIERALNESALAVKDSGALKELLSKIEKQRLPLLDIKSYRRGLDCPCPPSTSMVSRLCDCCIRTATTSLASCSWQRRVARCATARMRFAKNATSNRERV